MAEHCDQLPDDFRGRPVSLIPQLSESLVLLFADDATGIKTFRCSVCHQAWEEEYTRTERGETVRVRKVSRTEKITLPDPEVVSEAIVVWSGKGRTAWPARDEAFLSERFGDEALDLLPLVKGLAQDFYDSDAHHVVGDLLEMGNVAAQRFRRRYPELTEEAVGALRWCYTYDYK